MKAQIDELTDEMRVRADIIRASLFRIESGEALDVKRVSRLIYDPFESLDEAFPKGETIKSALNDLEEEERKFAEGQLRFLIELVKTARMRAGRIFELSGVQETLFQEEKTGVFDSRFDEMTSVAVELELSKTLRDARKRNSMSVRQLSKMSGVSPAYISLIENGKIGKPSIKIINRLSEVLGSDDLFTAAGLNARQARENLSRKVPQMPDSRYIDERIRTLEALEAASVIDNMPLHERRSLLSELRDRRDDSKARERTREKKDLAKLMDIASKLEDTQIRKLIDVANTIFN